ncbi:FGGY family carbohydrate kinase [Aminobacter sp. J44]|uniref:FGGY family carbohydrate kinase n=1 Tax=Aminobacter sp. J44 TaxID=935262 RepID=UPI0011998042|nr:FGGY family carbohydrate kinase [Aminobacter sp. J44]TWG55263.1 glycerol kinase [Aminobacter sp. J44]
MRIAAIDQGTTSSRVLVADEEGSREIRHSVRHAQIHPGPGRVEHDPLELLANVRACIEAAGPVDAIGIDNQGESCLAWDSDTLEPLSPVIVWQDSRTADLIEKLRQDGAEEITLARAGLPLDPYFSASKLAWIVEHLPAAKEALARGRLRLGTTDAYFLNCLTGRFITDTTTASRTSLMNLETRQWDPELCRLFGVPMECLPEIGLTAGEVLGEVNGVPLTASVVDQQAALYGHGCRKPGDAKITFGTGAFALAVTGTQILRAPDLGLLPTVAWSLPHETTYAVDGGVYDAGATIEWLRRIGLLQNVSLSEFPNGPAISRGLAFVPALSGLGCPYWDRSAAGLWIGMGGETTAEDLVQSALEGIALRTSEVLRAVDKQLRVEVAVTVDGGLSTNGYFTRFLADVTKRPIRAYRFSELTSLGCAALAGLAIGAELPRPEHGEEFLPAPDADTAAWQARFADAVSRCRNWR